MGRMKDEAVFDLEKVKEYLNKYDIKYVILSEETVEILEDVYFVDDDISFKIPAALFLSSEINTRYIEELGHYVNAYAIKFITNINSDKCPEVKKLFDSRRYKDCYLSGSRYLDEDDGRPFISTIYEG